MTFQFPVRLAMFDCDGTLVDGQYGIIAAMSEAFRAEGLPDPQPIDVRRVVGLPLLEAIATLAPDSRPGSHGTLARRYSEAFRALRQRPDHREPLFPGAIEVLDALESAGFLLGIATGKSRHGLLATLERHGLAGRFATLQTSDDGPGKPNPYMLLAAMAETGADPERTVMTGDTVFDIEMARGAAVAPIGVGWGYHEHEELRAAGAAAVLGSFAELPGVIERLIGRT